MLAGMELRQLRYFIAVAETGNISRAAKKIFLTQPALSRQIKALEEQLNQRLLERDAHSIRLTPAGEVLLTEARQLLEHAEKVQERVRNAGQGLCLRIGYAPSLAAGMLSAAIQNFTQTHISAHVELSDLSTAEMLAGLEASKLDVALCIGLPCPSRELSWISLTAVQWRLALSRNHPLARRSMLPPAEVAAERLLIYCRRDYPEYWQIISGWLGEHGLEPKVEAEYRGAEELMAAVESGLGVALVTTQMARLFPRRVSFATLADGPKPIDIAAGYRADRSDDNPLAVFLEELREAAKELG